MAGCVTIILHVPESLCKLMKDALNLFSKELSCGIFCFTSSGAMIFLI